MTISRVLPLTPCLTIDPVSLSHQLPGQPENVFVNGSIYCWNWESNYSYWIKEEDYTCREFDNGNCTCPELKADPDVAGIGVIIAFLVMAGLTIVTTIKLDILTMSEGETEAEESRPGRTGVRRRNRVHEAIYYRLQPNIALALRNRGWDVGVFVACASDVAKSLSDTQLVTGIAILLAVVIGLKGAGDPAWSMTVYHFKMALDLALISSYSHISVTLSGGRMNGKGRWGTKFSKTLWTVLLFGHHHERMREWQFKWLVGNLYVILIIYPVRIFRLFGPTFGMSALKLERSEANDTRPLVRNARYVLLKVLALSWDLLTADMAIMLLSISWFARGCTSLLDTRALGHSEMGVEQAVVEDRVGFGQLVPLVLLVLPLLAGFDSYAQHSADNQRRREEEVPRDDTRAKPRT
ncbi:hypothetical protein N658DRAFT_521080 [Parathielavia hyrcaniae]|uniref:Uncharacterized protein n=1 Tax=Parathielavia hyrcaniae TaxID=113614 RepID=A0AAN6T4Y7_9PEZI|nr:hypothetical protein N658DRAFT_521080 [Parathielavia hyrcaniae]